MINEPPPAATEIEAPRRLLITTGVLLASFMQAIDMTIANVALPRVQGSLSASLDQMSWVLTSYIIAAAVMTPLTGWLTGQMGRKRVFLYSVAGFTVASMLCGLAQSLPQLVLARVLQGVCGAALVPLSQAVLLDINPPSRHGRAMALWVMGSTLAPIFGPALGGWITENYTWRWVFYLNVPVGLLAFSGLLASLPETPARRSRFDFFGFSVLSLSVGCLQLFLDRGQQKDWFSSTEICIEAGIAALSLYLFVMHTLTTTNQRFVSIGLFKDRNFVTGNVLMFAMGLILFATLSLMPPMLQELLSYPVVTAGLIMTPRGLVSMVSLLLVGRIIDKVDTRFVIVTGFVLTAISAWQMTGFNLQMDAATVVQSSIAQGFASGFVFVPATVATFSTLAATLRDEGAAILNLTRNIGASVGVSAAQTLLTRNTQIEHAVLAQHVNPFSAASRAHLGASPSPQAMAALNEVVNRQAIMLAYNDNFKLLLITCLAVIPLVFLLRKTSKAAAAAVLID